jgi:hypothetical protein
MFHEVLLAVYFIVNQLSAVYRFMLFTDVLLSCGKFSLTDSLQLRNVLSVSTSCNELCETNTNQKDLIKLIFKTFQKAIFLLQNIGHENNKRNIKMIGNNV